MEKFFYGLLSQLSELRKAPKSRTAWAAVGLFLLASSETIKGLLLPVVPDPYYSIIEAVLAGLIVFFHVNPSREYGAKKEPA